MTNSTVTFDVGGKIFKVNRSLLLKFDDKMMLRVAAEMSDNSNEPIFIDRDGERFVYVLDYMRDRKASLPLSMSKGSFISDLMFYGIDVSENNVILSGNCASQIQLCVKNHHVELRKLQEEIKLCEQNHEDKLNKIRTETEHLTFKIQSRSFAKSCLDKMISSQNPSSLVLPSFFNSKKLNDERTKYMREVFAEYGFLELDFTKWPSFISAKTY